MRFTRLFLAVILALASSLAYAQDSADSPRITSPILESQLVTLQGNLPNSARAEFDQGALPDGTLIKHMRLVLSRSTGRQAALNAFMAGQLNPVSANFHNWLTPSQFGRLYGANNQDIHTIIAWLQSHGFTIERIDSGRLSIAFSGNVDLVENAFHTHIHKFSVNGESFFSNVTDPEIPAALAPVIAGVTHLNSIQPKPHSLKAHAGKFDANSHKFIPLNHSDDSTAHSPEFTSDGYLNVTPQDAATIYNSPLSAAFPGNSSNNGNGVTIGIGGDAMIQGSVVWNYRNLFLGQPIPAPSAPTSEPCGPGESDCTGTVAVQQQGQLTIFNLDGVTANGDSVEAYIDTELSGGLAPGANIFFYASQDLDSANQQMVYDNQVNLISLSFGECEANMGAAYNLFYYDLWQQAAAQGIAVFVSTGDSGSAGCDYNVVTTQYGLAVNGLASTPYNVAVGGTDFYALLNGGFNNYVNPESSAGVYYGTAISFIPESSWNDSTFNNTTYDQNIASNYGGSGSGGISSCVNADCNDGYHKPAWQAAPGVPSDGLRDLPDIALFAANGFYGADWLVCDDSYPCILSGSSFSFDAYGGTSTSAPATAGIFALVSQKAGGNIGLPNPALYTLASGPDASDVFHDTVLGNNSVLCSGPAGECITYAGGDFLDGYNTTAGFDLVTGLGSINITNLLADWPATLFTPTIVLSPSATNFNSSQTLTVGVSVNGSAADGGAPAGTVTLTIASYSGGSQTLTAGSNNGTATFTVPANSLPAGADLLSVTYSGGGNYSAAQAGTTLKVVQTTYTISATDLNINAGDTTGNNSTITVTPSGGYAGTVTWTATVSPSNLTGTPTFSYLPTAGLVFTAAASAAQTGSVAVTTYTDAAIKAPTDRHAGLIKNSGWFTAATGSILASFLLLFLPPSRKWRKRLIALFLVSALGFTIMGCGGSSQPVAPSVTVTPSKSTFNNNTAVSFQVAVAAPAGNSGVPTGTISLSGAGAAAITGTLAGGAVNIPVPANTFTEIGSQTIYVSYNGDTHFTSANGSATVTIYPPPTTHGSYVVTVTAVGTDSAKTTKSTTFNLTVN